MNLVEIGVKVCWGILQRIVSLHTNKEALLIYTAINSFLLFVSALIILISFICVRKRKKKKFIAVLNEDMDEADFNRKKKERMSLASLDTEHEFSYYDEIVNTRPATEIGTMKLLPSK